MLKGKVQSLWFIGLQSLPAQAAPSGAIQVEDPTDWVTVSIDSN